MVPPEIILEEEKEGIELLADFGLEQEESIVYIGLLRLGVGKASEICHFTNIDRVKGYKILENLKNKGFVTSTLSSPTLFSANEPNTVLNSIINKNKQRLQKLEGNIHRLSNILEKLKLKPTKTDLPKLTVIAGKDNIHDQILKIINESKKELYIITTASDLIQMYHTEIPDAVKKIVKQKINVKLITEETILSRMEFIDCFGVVNFKINKLPSKGRVICNTTQVLMTGYTTNNLGQNLNSESALVTNSNEITGNMMSLCEFMWETGSVQRCKIKNQTAEKKSALIISNDTDTNEVLSKFLELKNVNTEPIYEDYKKGMERYKKQNFDVIFLDCISNPHRGISAFKEIMKDSKNTKVVLIADEEDKISESVGKLKPAKILYKPSNFEKILEKVI